MKKIIIIVFLFLAGEFVYSQPLPPIPIFPSGDTCINPQNLHFNWHPSIGATSYRIQVGTGVNTVLDVSGITDTFYIPISSIFNLNTVYYWRLKAYGLSGESPWAPYWHFATCPNIPDPPTLLGPPDSSVVTLFPVFDWTDVTGATQYRIQISTSPLFNSTVLNVAGLVNSGYVLSSPVLTNSTLYYWRVNASNAGGTSPWSSVWRFITAPAPPVAPSIIYPYGQINVPLTPTLDWTDVPGATSYRIQFSPSNIFDTVVVPSEVTIPPGKLNYYTMYFWRVAAINTGGQSPWSVICNFTTINSIGIKLISSEVPAEYKLYNNYPNPFNPTTNIKYQIPGTENGKSKIENSFVSLKVYDVLGKEVAILVNEYQKPGIYEVPFSIFNYSDNQFPNGIYFYTIHSGDFTDTKRMVLIK